MPALAVCLLNSDCRPGIPRLQASRVRGFFPRPYKIFIFHMQRIGDAINVIEKTYHLGGIMNGPIGKAVLA